MSATEDREWIVWRDRILARLRVDPPRLIMEGTNLRLPDRLLERCADIAAAEVAYGPLPAGLGDTRQEPGADHG